MPAALLAAILLQANAETLAELERAYDQTCNSRIYGQFDGMCSDMAEQVKRYRAELKHQPRATKEAAPAAPAPAAPVRPAEPSPGPLAPPAPKG